MVCISQEDKDDDDDNGDDDDNDDDGKEEDKDEYGGESSSSSSCAASNVCVSSESSHDRFRKYLSEGVIVIPCSFVGISSSVGTRVECKRE